MLTIDFYQKFKPTATEKQLVRFGRISTIILVILSLGWIPFMKALMGGGIFHYLQSIQAYISPPIAAVFLLGLIYPWINARGAIVTLWVGFGIGVTRLIMEFISGNGSFLIESDSWIAYFLEINFLHFALFLFLFCSGVLIVVSKLTKPQPATDLVLVTFQKRTSKSSFKWTLDVGLSIVLILAVLCLWMLFSPFGIG